MCDSLRPTGSEMICLRERQTRFLSSICWQKQRVARTRYQEFKILETQGSSEWNEESIKALARVLIRQAGDKYAFPIERHQSAHLQKILG